MKQTTWLKTLSALLVTVTLFLAPVWLMADGQSAYRAITIPLVAHAGGGSAYGGGDDSTDSSVTDPGEHGLGYSESVSSMTGGFGIVDAIAAVASFAIGGPVGLAASIGISMGATALGISNPGISVSVSSYSGVSVTASSNVGMGGVVGAALGAIGVDVEGSLSGLAEGVSSAVSGVSEAVSNAFGGFAISSFSPVGEDRTGYDSPYNDGGGNGGDATQYNYSGQAAQANIMSASGTPDTPICSQDYTLLPQVNNEPNQCVLSSLLEDSYTYCPDSGGYFCTIGQQCSGDGRCRYQTGRCSSNYGSVCRSAANSCGMTGAGTIMCDGSTCSASVPSDQSCPPPSITLTEAPSLVNLGGVCTIHWEVSDATTCSLSSDTGDSLSGVNLPAGSHDSPALTSQTAYTMLCHNGNTITSSASVTCRLNPAFQNI